MRAKILANHFQVAWVPGQSVLLKRKRRAAIKTRRVDEKIWQERKGTSRWSAPHSRHASGCKSGETSSTPLPHTHPATPIKTTVNYLDQEDYKALRDIQCTPDNSVERVQEYIITWYYLLPNLYIDDSNAWWSLARWSQAGATSKPQLILVSLPWMFQV